MAISVREVLHDENTGGAASVTTGAGTQSTDLLVCIGMSEYYNLSGNTYGPPSGGSWTEVVTGQRAGDDSKLRVWVKTAPGGATTVSLNGLADEGHGLCVLVLEGADTADPVDGSAGAAYTASGTSHPAPSISPVTSDVFMVSAVATEVFGGGGTFSAPSGMTERDEYETTGGGVCRTTVATQQLAASGATGAKSFTYSSSGIPGVGVSVGIKTSGSEPPDTPYKVADRGSASNLTSSTSTSVDLPSAGSIAVGNVLIARLAMDNSGTDGAATTVSISDPRSNTWTVGAAANRDPGAANAGISCRIAYCVVENAYTDGDDLTVTYGNNTAADSVIVEEWANIDTATPVAVAQTTADGASTAPSISRTPSAADQLMYCAVAIEGPSGDTYTQDADTTNGSWSSLTSVSTASGTAASNATTRGAYKVVTASGAQTWTPTITSRDWAAVGLVFNAASTAVSIAPADAAHAHAADSPALTQAHVLATADTAHGQSADSPALTQVHQIAADSASHSQTADAAGLTQAHALAPADAAHAQSADEPSLAQVHSLAAADSTHAQTADAAGLTQLHELAADSSTHGHTAEQPALTGTHTLAAADSTHSHTATVPVLVEVVALAPAGSTHAHQADAPALTQLHALSPAGAVHGHTAGEPDLAAGYSLVAADAVHGHTADVPALTQAHILTADDAAHAQVAGQPALTQVHLLAAADAEHGQTADQPELTGGAQLAADDSTHSHSATQPGITQTHLLAVDGAVHAQTGDAPALTQAHDLDAQDASHGHTADAADLTGSTLIAPDDATHPTTAGAASLGQVHLIAASPAQHAHTADTAAITQLHLLAALSATHLHLADVVTLVAGITGTPPSRTTVVPGNARTSVLSGIDRTVYVPPDARTTAVPDPARSSSA